jgi:serine/threonine protein kinase
VIPGVGIGVTGVACALLVYLMLLICRKRKELADSKDPNSFIKNRTLILERRWKLGKWRKGPSPMFRRFSYKEIQRATNGFCTIIGRGGFGTVYKAQFENGFIAAVKRMNKVSQQGEEEFCKETELLGRLHHRHLVTLRGFCAEKHERFLVYEYMENGSLKEHLHASRKPPMSWRTRIQIAADVATALEYLHFFCDPPLCHRDIKSSNILLDGNFVAKVADFGLAHAAPSGAIKFEPINTDIRGTPGYMDPEYVTTQELTEKSDIYSYGVLLLELITARRAVHENKNLVEWAQQYFTTCSRLPEIVDPNLADNYNFEQLQGLISIVKLCTQREGKARPSMKQVLRLLYNKIDTDSHNLMMAPRDKDAGNNNYFKTMNKGKVETVRSSNGIDHSGDLRCLQSSPSTSRSFCSRSFLLESGSPRSPVST